LLAENKALKAQINLLKTIQLVKSIVESIEQPSGLLKEIPAMLPSNLAKGKTLADHSSLLDAAVPSTQETNGAPKLILHHDAPSAAEMEPLAIIPLQTQLPPSSIRFQDASLTSHVVSNNGAAAVGASLPSQVVSNNGAAAVGKFSSLAFPFSPLMDTDVHNMPS
jgi:hypothetical protein